MCVSCLWGVLSVLLEKSSQDTNHTPRLGCLFSTFKTVELHLFLFCSLCLSTSFSRCLSPHSWNGLFHNDVSWPHSCFALLLWYSMMRCSAMERNWSSDQWHPQAFYGTGRKMWLYGEGAGSFLVLWFISPQGHIRCALESTTEALGITRRALVPTRGELGASKGALGLEGLFYQPGGD